MVFMQERRWRSIKVSISELTGDGIAKNGPLARESHNTSNAINGPSAGVSSRSKNGR